MLQIAVLTGLLKELLLYLGAGARPLLPPLVPPLEICLNYFRGPQRSRVYVCMYEYLRL